MTNQFRSPSYLKLKHSINSCTNQAQLETLYEPINRHLAKTQHENDIMILYIMKMGELSVDNNVYEEAMLNLHHKRLSA